MDIPRQFCVKIIVMQKLFLVSLIVALAGCSKQQEAIPSKAWDAFFGSGTDAEHTTQALVKKHSPEESLQAIDRISYLYSGNEAYALVFYRTDKDTTNLIIRKEYRNGVEVEMTSSKCDGRNCDCLVIANIGHDGSVSLRCNCSSCSIVTSQLEHPH